MSKLAIDSGGPVRTAPFPPWPEFRAKNIEAAAAALRSGRVNHWTGPEGRRFELEFAAATASKHAVAMAKGTVALELKINAVGSVPIDAVQKVMTRPHSGMISG